MAHKLAVYAGRAGVPDTGLLLDAYYIAVRPRLARTGDVFHIDILHPARNALILLEHTACRDVRVLAAAALTETFDPTLRAPAADKQALGADVVALAEAVPQTGDADDGLLEALLVAELDVVRIALADRLDHARHLHMRARPLWDDYYRQTVDVYLPVAARTEPELFLRFQRWASAFQRRLSE